ncbi:MAG: helix-turn-helix domain-containing protein [Alphaproteobacteria bacterium]
MLPFPPASVPPYGPGFDNPDRLITERELADLLGVSTRATQAWRQRRSDGPPFLKLSDHGRVRYRVGDVVAWINARSRRSTSDSGPERPEAA